MTAPVLGIDLGTTNSVVAVADAQRARVLADAEGYKLIPSVVSFHPNGEIIVGRAARERRLLDARNTVYSVKRLIGRPFKSAEVTRARERFPFSLQEGPTGGVLVAARSETYTLSEISAFVLREVRTQAEQALGTTCTQAVITVPANFNELQRSATKAAGRVAGLDVLRILNEPTAAALAYGYGRGSRERIAIYDLGGGTFDLTILELAGDVFEVLATAGDTYLGGDDIDTLIAEQMATAFLEHHEYDPRTDAQAFERLRVAAEWAKCQLSTEQEVQLRIEELAYGDDGLALDLAFALTRPALEQMAMPLVSRSFDVCEDAMRVAGIRPTQLDNVILVGGSTRMPLVQRLVAEYFGRDPLASIDPDLVVAEGAAIQGLALSTARPRASAASTRPVARVSLKRITLSELEQEHAKGPPAKQQWKSPDEEDITAIRGSQHVPTPEESEATLPAVTPSSGLLRSKTTSSIPPATGRWKSAPPAGLPSSKPPPGPPKISTPPPPPIPPAPAVVVGTPPRGAAPPAPPPSPRAATPPFDGGGSTSAPRPAPRVPTLPGGASPPLLLDVTPQSLGVATVSGFCEHVIKRNAAIPVEQTRIFTTADDDQRVVRVQICQGESRRLAENQALGEVELTGLRPAPRGEVKIGVTFVIDADGTLDVRAQDLATGQQQTIRINLIGGVADADIEQMKRRHQQLFH